MARVIVAATIAAKFLPPLPPPFPLLPHGCHGSSTGGWKVYFRLYSIHSNIKISKLYWCIGVFVDRQMKEITITGIITKDTV
jgi:hypothetical protein